MLCEQCGKMPATVFLVQIVDGERAKRNLCESCAAPVIGKFPPSQGTSDSLPSPLDTKILERPSNSPSEIMLTDPITVRELASALHAKVYQVVAVLMQRNIFASPGTSLDFATASSVCTYYGVTPRKFA